MVNTECTKPTMKNIKTADKNKQIVQDWIADHPIEGSIPHYPPPVL